MKYVLFNCILSNGPPLCLVVRVPRYRSGGPGFDSRAQKKVVALERGSLSLVSAVEDLTE
jgi:hypothetical protein